MQPKDTVSIAFEMPADVLRTVSMSVLEGVMALPRRGLEVGGLLVGTSSLLHINVEDAVPILSEYPEGPAYRVPEEVLRAELNGVEGALVGYYRSRTDGKVGLDGQDELFLRMLGSFRDAAVLVIRQQRDVPAELHLGLWHDGMVTWCSNVLQLSECRNGILVDVPGNREAVEESIAAVPPSISPVPASALTEPARVGGSEWRRPVATAALAAALLFGSASAGWMLRGRSEAHLEIPKAPMAVYGRARKAEVPQEQTSSPAALADTLTNRTSAPPRVETPAAAAPAPVAIPASPPTAKVRRAFAPPPALSAQSRVAAVPELIAEAPGISAAAVTASGGVVLHGTDVRVPDPGPTLTATPPLQFRPPALMSQSTGVVIPTDVRRLLRSAVVLELRARIDKSGRVSAIEPVQPIRDIGVRALVLVYSAAIREWVFQPARRNGEAIPGELVLRFRVNPQ